MKKFIGLLVALIIIGGAFFVYSEYSGKDYYTKITNTGKKIAEKAKDGSKITSYEYSLKSVNEKGDEKVITFKAPNRTKPLKLNAYLKLKYNNKKGVLNWEEVKQSNVPAKAIDKLNKK